MTPDDPAPDDGIDDRDEDGGTAGGLRDRLGAAFTSVETARLVAGAGDQVNRWRRERKVGKGTLRSTQVVAYRGWVAGGTAQVRVRVAEGPPLPETGDWLPYVDVLKANVRRFVALPLPGVRVDLAIAGSTVRVTTDRRGYAVARIPVPDLAPGWFSYRCLTVPDDPDEEPVTATGEVLVADPAADVAVVSDIDDTVLRTGLTEGIVAVNRTLFRDANTRRPVPGMSRLYQGLRHGAAGGTPRPFWYLSTGPWAMYDTLTQFLARNGFPDGPLLLTDWGLNERYVIRSGREHKRASLRRLLADNPRPRFVLVGDSGQGDAEVYVEAARDHPGRCAALVLLDVGEHRAERAEELRGWEDDLAADGIAFHLVPDAARAAEVLAGMGLIDPAIVPAVRAATEDRA